MNAQYYTEIPLQYLCIVLAIGLLLSIVINILNNHLFTLHVFVRKFSLFDLQSPATPLELATYINGIYILPAELKKSSLRSLKAILFLDFLMMPFLYGSIFLLCMQLSGKFTGAGHPFFAILAWLQIVPWLCNVIQNIFLLKKIHPKTEPSTSSVFALMQIFGLSKWILSLGVLVICISILVYLWLEGNYRTNSLYFFIIILAEILLFLFLKKTTARNPEVILDRYHDVVN